MRHRLFQISILAGIISGGIIGIFLKCIQAMTGIKVYTLLLNIDFIPVINKVTFPEIVEFFFHLIVSVMLTFILFLVVDYLALTIRKRLMILMGFSVVVGVFIYPITALSSRTPALFSGNAIIWWLIAHLLYGFILSWFYLLRYK